MVEEWKDIIGLEGRYQISNFGNVKSLNYNEKRYERVLKPQRMKTGYLCVNIGGKLRTIHRLVAIAFIENPKNCPCVNHKDGNKKNNNVNNLEWCSYGQNIKHAYKTGLKVATSNHLKRKILQYDKNMNFIKEGECTKDVQRSLGIYHSNISVCCEGRQKTAGGYIWRYADDR